MLSGGKQVGELRLEYLLQGLDSELPKSDEPSGRGVDGGGRRRDQGGNDDDVGPLEENLGH